MLDTLESVKAQSYSLLELVVSDDCSTDDTVALCRDWIEKNKARFVSVKVVVAPKNQGISANYNQGMDNCTGEYIKEIAGDDMLLPNCVEDYVNFVTEHPEANFCFGKVKCFGVNDEMINAMERIFNYEMFQKSREEQLCALSVFGNWIPSASFFYSKYAAQKIKLRNDERIPFMEDWPKWINILKSGNQLYFVDEYVAKYRLSEQQLSTNTNNRWERQKSLLYIYYMFFPTCKELGVLKGIKRLINNYRKICYL